MNRTREIVDKAVKDEAFRERLLKDSRAAIKEEFGLELSEGVTVRVHQNSPSILNIVLPAPVDSSRDRSLTEQELELVAGGLAKRSVGSAISPWI